MKKVRIGIVGMGNMGRFHAQDLIDGKVEGGELVAVASTSPDKLKEYGEQGLKVFGGGEEMIHSGAIDAIVIVAGVTILRLIGVYPRLCVVAVRVFRVREVLRQVIITGSLAKALLVGEVAKLVVVLIQMEDGAACSISATCLSFVRSK